eukprot:TRINITY_DN2369_c0_g1_i2.p1 TRINITY_DN2369_c0_g1~~TRINITY_DN2369_c0_g1_i2.p1  ORF type:complete len:239 (+),score=56.39 TRINITY_DN2369_c0_g1_i2:235-951(+)
MSGYLSAGQNGAGYLAGGIRQHRFSKRKFDGIERIPVYNRFLYHLRPWDSTPSPVYVEEDQRRTWWYVHPPSFLFILLVLCSVVLVNYLIAFLPLASNARLLRLRWRDLVKPPWGYEQGWLLLYSYFLTHLFASLSCWFVYLDGGVEKQRVNFLPYCLLLLLEAVWGDVMFRAKFLLGAFLIWLAMTLLCGATIVVFLRRVATMAGLFMIPSFIQYLYGTIFIGYLIKYNGAHYTVTA